MRIRTAAFLFVLWILTMLGIWSSDFMGNITQDREFSIKIDYYKKKGTKKDFPGLPSPKIDEQETKTHWFW